MIKIRTINKKFLLIFKNIVILALLFNIETFLNQKNYFYKEGENINEILFHYKLFMQELPKYNQTHKHSRKIFWCWLQGENEIPILSKACLNSVRRNCKGYEIIIITENNINKYIHIPPYIFKKYKNHYMKPAHFADLIRLELLLKYGGTWIDSSVLITNYDEIFFNKDLFFFQAINIFQHF